MSNPGSLATGAILLLTMAVASFAVEAANHRETRFVATLAGSSEVPAVSMAGRGSVRATLNAEHTMLTWRVTYRGLSGAVVAAHFHGPAQIGENAGVAVALSGGLMSPISGTSSVTAAQADELLAGKWYLNLHTAMHPDGEVRGQLTQKRR